MENPETHPAEKSSQDNHNLDKIQENGNTAEKKFSIPESNIIYVNPRKNAKFWIFLSKIYLKHFEEIELRGFYDGISVVVI